MGWLVAENELDREQNNFLMGGLQENGSYSLPFMARQRDQYIQGFPGSGKTVLMMYALAAHLYEYPEAKVLIVEFTHSLIKMLEAALQELIYRGRRIDTSQVKVVTYYDYVENYEEENFDLILCDEVQDLPERPLKRMSRNKGRIVFAGDFSQSIYKRDPKWRQEPCSENFIKDLFHPNVIELHFLHRFGSYVAQAVNAFMPEMNILSGRIPMTRSNVQVSIWIAQNKKQEVSEIYTNALDTIKVTTDSVAILLPSHRKIRSFVNRILKSKEKNMFRAPTYDRERNRHTPYNDMEGINEHLRDNGIPIQYVANGFGDFVNSTGLITITTYHSSKGIDFDKVFMPFCEPIERNNQDEDLERRLFMVAMTRCRKDLVISYSQTPNHLVQKFAHECNIRDLGYNNNLTGLNNESTDRFGF